jgi:hypothetical protein
MTRNRYWDVYECRWQEYDSTELGRPTDMAGVPQPRPEAEAPLAAAESYVAGP